MNDKELKRILSGNIRRGRISKGLSQFEFAEMVNISVPFLSDIENGKKWVSPATLTSIAHTLNTEVYELFKPEGALPDNALQIFEKYASDANDAVFKALTSLRDKYIALLKDQNS